MKTYIEYIGDLLLHKISQGEEVILVLPNKRPLAYLQKCMAHKSKQALWFPKVFTIEDFVLDLTHMQLAEPLYTASCLYEIYHEILQDQADSFDDFIKWWSIIISDFNDIDMYMTDSRQLFNYINEAKAIEQWNPGQQEPTKLQQHYLTFWKFLPVFYTQLNKKLGEQNMGYRGMIYRKAAEMLAQQEPISDQHHVIFAGFNALSTSEELIIEYYLQANKGTIYWESDDYYLLDEKQEAGKFLRHYKNKWQAYANAIFFSNNSLLYDEKEINIIGAPKSMMQATSAGQLVQQILSRDYDTQPVHAALIPADEGLLNPLLYQLPSNDAAQINISMGYSVAALPLNSFYALVLNLIHSLEKEKQALFSSYQLNQLLSHPYAPVLFNKHQYQNAVFEIKKIKSKILSSGKINFTLKELALINDEINQVNFYWFFEDLVNVFHDVKAIAIFLTKINKQLLSLAQNIDSIKELIVMQVNLYNQAIDEISKVFFHTEPGVIKQSKTFFSLLNQSVAGKSLPFIGNATGGLQLIGLLETRMLQFDELIITGCNEGILPNAKSSGNSFIPFDIRYQFNLPTYKDSEAVFAYHFYRLIQGAKKVHLIYNTETDEFGSGEKSRFITQLEMELSIKNNKAIINNEIIKMPAAVNFKRKAISFKHDHLTEKNLTALCEKGLSATAIISYKNCPLQFYFKYLAQIKEPKEIATEVEANIVGSVIHAVLEKIYTPLKNNYLSIAQIQYPFEEIENMTLKAFHEIEPGADSTSGKNLLFIQTAVRIISNFLTQEQKQIKQGSKIKLLHTEQHFETQITQGINLRGTIDRIDEWNSKLRIIDYKTGTVDESKLKLKSIEDVFEDPAYDKAFQLLFYTLLYHKNFPGISSEVEAGIISLRKISDGLYSVSSTDDSRELMKLFEQQLNLVIKQLTDPQRPFEQTQNHDICAYCAFKNICMR